jgi:hypothetical protein
MSAADPYSHEPIGREERGRIEALNMSINSFDRLAIRVGTGKSEEEEPTSEAIVDRAEVFRKFLAGESS